MTQSLSRFLRGAALAVLVWAACAMSSSAQTPALSLPLDNARPWISAYYLSGDADTGRLLPQKIDFTAFSHLIHFGIFPKSDGTINLPPGSISPEQSKTVISLAHAVGCKVLVSVGSQDGTTWFQQAIQAGPRAALVHNLVQFVLNRGYDGLDLDFEPLGDADVSSYEKFIFELRARLIAANPSLLLTAAVASEPAMFARLQSQFDQINLMTYELSGPWPGFKTWYNANLYDGGTERMANGDVYPSTDGMVQDYLKAGIAPAKLGIGIVFGGHIWSGATGPRQSIQGVTMDDGADYSQIMDTYYQPQRYHWDPQAQAPYLSVDAAQVKDRKFITYDDETLCMKKVQYIRQKGLGGAIIWELGGGYRGNQPDGQKDTLLQAVKQAWRGSQYSH